MTADHRRQTIEVTVGERRVEAAGVVSLTLGRSDGQQLPPWEPGAHIDLHLPSGTVRQYSLCGSPDDVGYRVAILSQPDGRGGSLEACSLSPGCDLRISHPRNQFPLVEAPQYLLIGGGIGITPLLPMAQHLQAAGRDWNLVYGGRDRDSMAFVDQLLELGSRVTVLPQDEHGLPDLATILGAAAPGTAVYCCGPAGMIAAAQALCHRLPPDGSLHTERFTPTQEPLSGTDSAADSFRVVLRRRACTVTVGANQSILDAVRETGAVLPSSCEEGHCGTCETDVVEGIPDHRDEFLTEDERAANTTMMICVSRSLSDELVLDL